jgi:hypothetical protein
VFGGPRGLDTDGLTAAEVVVSYQNAEDAPPYRTMRAKQGVVVDAADAAGSAGSCRRPPPGSPATPAAATSTVTAARSAC